MHPTEELLHSGGSDQPSLKAPAERGTMTADRPSRKELTSKIHEELKQLKSKEIKQTPKT